MNITATVLGIVIIFCMVMVGGNILVTAIFGNLSPIQIRDITVLVLFVLAAIYIAWLLLKFVVYNLFFTATKAICEAKNKTNEEG